MSGKISGYPNTATIFPDGSFWDFSKYVSPGTWQSQKIPQTTMLQLMLDSNVQQILQADLVTLASASGLTVNKTYLVDGAVSGDRLLRVIAATASALYQSAFDLTTGETGVYDLGTDTFVSNVFPYVVISKANYETAYTDGKLVKGTKYRITDAISTGIFATPNEIDAVVLATSGSTIYEIAEYPEIQGFGKSDNLVPGGNYGAWIVFNGIPFSVAQAAIIDAASGNVENMFYNWAKPTFRTSVGGVVTLIIADDATGIVTNNVYSTFAGTTTPSFGDYDLATGVFTPYLSQSILIVDTTAVGNVGSGEDNLISYTIPTYSITDDGNFITFEMSGSFAGNINAKRVRVYLETSLIFDSGALSIVSSSDWVIKGTIIKITDSSFKASVTFNSSFSTLSSSAKYTSGSEDFTTALTLKATGEAVSTNDIIQELLIVKKNM